MVWCSPPHAFCLPRVLLPAKNIVPMHSNWKVTMLSKYCAIQLPLLVDLRNWKWQQSRFCLISSTLIQFRCGPAPFGSHYLFSRGELLCLTHWGTCFRWGLPGKEGGNNEADGQNGECGYEKWKFIQRTANFSPARHRKRTLLRIRNIRLRIFLIRRQGKSLFRFSPIGSFFSLLIYI